MEVHKEKIEPKETIIEVKKTPDTVDNTDGLAETTKEIKNIEEYEIEKGHKFAENYFDVRNIVAEDKIMRMEISQIDKYIKNKIEKNGMAKTVDNYSHLLSELENEIGSSRLETYKRIQKIIGYLKVLNKYNKLKELKEKYGQTKTNSN